MKREQKIALYQQAIEHFGLASQVTMVFEETGELQNALAKFIRGRCTRQAVITELADVYIMVEQMARLFGQEHFAAEKERKLNRLARRIGITNGNKSNKKNS